MSGFDVGALHDALDAERQKRGITWAQLTRELNALFKDVTRARPIATSTVTGMRNRGGLQGNGIIQMLIWLDRSPESFCDEWPVKGRKLPKTSTDTIARWNSLKIYEALDVERQKRGLTWKEVAAELGPHFTPSTLKTMSASMGLGFPYGMEIFRWLRKPAADFVAAVPW